MGARLDQERLDGYRVAADELRGQRHLVQAFAAETPFNIAQTYRAPGTAEAIQLASAVINDVLRPEAISISIDPVMQARHQSTERAEKQKQQDSDARLLRSLLEDHLAQMEANNERLAVLARYEKGINRHIEKLRNGEEIEFAEDGVSLKDKDAEEAIREYERTTGVKVDRTNADQVGKVKTFMIEPERAKLQADNDRLKRESDEALRYADQTGSANDAELKGLAERLQKAGEQGVLDKNLAEASKDVALRTSQHLDQTIEGQSALQSAITEEGDGFFDVTPSPSKLPRP